VKQHRGLLIYTGLFILIGLPWLAVSVYYRLAWWWIAAGALAIAAVAECGEQAITRRLDRPKRDRRRTHARPHPDKTRRAA
jgi:hypothetical protein